MHKSLLLVSVKKHYLAAKGIVGSWHALCSPDLES